MKLESLTKVKVFTVLIFFIGASFLSHVSTVSNASGTQSLINDQDSINRGNGETEYWALLVAVGVYADAPQQNRPLMLEEIDDLYDVLLESPWWPEDHIKVIKGKDATVVNIIKGLRWLDNKEDSDDISMVFITTHGSPLGFDIPPFDEDDGTDEILLSYWGFTYPGLFVYDDEINFLLNKLESQGVCLIVDSCYAGGFNDPPDWNKTHMNILPFQRKESKMSSTEWIEGFAEDVRGQNRVVLMASREDEVSYSGGFAPYLIDGLRGFADANMDNIISAEEAFLYSEPRASRQHPTMYDGYDGELPLIDYSGFIKKIKIDDKIIENEETLLQIYEGNLNENSIVCGYVKDFDTNEPVKNAFIDIWGRDNEWQFYENDTTSDSSGFYSMNVPPSRFRISVYADGYCGGESGFHEIGENEIVWMNFSLYPRPLEISMVCGYITDNKTGNPIDGANISLMWWEQDQFYRNDTTSDYTGFYMMNVAAGEIYLEIEADGYFHKSSGYIAIDEFETLWMNFSLYQHPVETSKVCGYITDNETGGPINDAHITFEWFDVISGGSYQKESHTNLSGFYSLKIAPGELYHDIRQQGYEYYNPYRHDTKDNKTLWLNITLEEEIIEIDIAKPLNALYLNNKRVMPFTKTRIIGDIDIEVYVYDSWHGSGEAEKVEFYIDDSLKKTITTEPYTWTWDEKIFGKHIVKVVAYDEKGNSISKEIEVRKLL